MAEVDQTKNKIIVTCDCGIVTKIFKDEQGELICKSTITKQQKKELENGKKRETEKDNNESVGGKSPEDKSRDIFDELIK